MEQQKMNLNQTLKSFGAFFDPCEGRELIWIATLWAGRASIQMISNDVLSEHLCKVLDLLVACSQELAIVKVTKIETTRNQFMKIASRAEISTACNPTLIETISGALDCVWAAKEMNEAWNASPPQSELLTSLGISSDIFSNPGKLGLGTVRGAGRRSVASGTIALHSLLPSGTWKQDIDTALKADSFDIFIQQRLRGVGSDEFKEMTDRIIGTKMERCGLFQIA
jgi:hypothetical protein